MTQKIEKSDAEWRQQLGDEAYRICRRRGTEPAFSGKYATGGEDGVYRCRCCGAELFDSAAKYDSGTGWPSFFQPVTPAAVEEHADRSLFRVRTEIRCSRCDAHLGHVFPDGPEPTGQRFCMNSAALDLAPRESD